MRKPLPSQAELNKLFSYDPDTGVLTWRVRSEMAPEWNSRYAGQPAGSKHRLYVCIGHGNKFFVHRVIWKMVHNEEPPMVDHKDCDPSNNRLNNLRPATHGENNRNQRTRRNGLKGAYLHKASGLWAARVARDGVLRHCSYHKTEELAHAKYVEVAQELFGEFARAA